MLTSLCIPLQHSHLLVLQCQKQKVLVPALQDHRDNNQPKWLSAQTCNRWMSEKRHHCLIILHDTLRMTWAVQ